MCSLTDYFHFHWMIQLLTVIPNSENNKKETVPTHYHSFFRKLLSLLTHKLVAREAN